MCFPLSSSLFFTKRLEKLNGVGEYLGRLSKKSPKISGR